MTQKNNPPAGPGAPLLQVRGLGRVYGRGEAAVTALQDVNFSVERGSFVSIVGPSGPGKSTLLPPIGGGERPPPRAAPTRRGPAAAPTPARARPPPRPPPRPAGAHPPVMVLDEATSSIDTRTERHIEKGMDALMEDRTVFVIAHRLSTVRNSNCIVVIEHGEIQEKGGHEDLLAQKGRYYMLYTGQHILD